ncbi:MAG: SPOR domain-containing protein, partial [Caulobacteraceae bacterium]
AVAKVDARASKAREAEAEAAPCPTVHGRHHRHAACEAAQVAKAERAEKADKSDRKSGGYMIQVGAYRNHTLAKDQLDKMANMVDGHAQVEHAGGNYRARFSGLSQREAKAACRTLAAHGHPCMVLGQS